MFRFVRAEKMHEIQRAILLGLLDDPRYQFYFGADWEDLPKENESPGWAEDAVLIQVPSANGPTAPPRTAGFLTWGIQHYRRAVDHVSVLLGPSYLNRGLGARVLATWLQYALVTRRFRKVEFTCHADNAPALRMYEQIAEVGGREVGVHREHSLLRDGQYHDRVLFEILGSEFRPTPTFERLVVADAWSA